MRGDKDIFFIVVHHTGDNILKCLADIDRVHREKGWRNGCGYDYVINRSGKLEIGPRWDRKYRLVGGHLHIKGDIYNTWNKHALSICLMGNFEDGTPTPIQEKTLIKFLIYQGDKLNIPPYRILTHQEIKSTDCPGKNLQENLEIIRKELIVRYNKSNNYCNWEDEIWEEVKGYVEKEPELR